DFYPEGTKPVDFLRFYGERFPSVELNASAYQLPAEEHFRTWAEQVPPDFRFAVRMPRQITHGSRLGLVGTFCERARVLGDKLGPVLVPLERKRDDGFLMLLRDSLVPGLEVAFDFRHESWGVVEVRPEAQAGLGKAVDEDPAPGELAVDLGEAGSLYDDGAAAPVRVAWAAWLETRLLEQLDQQRRLLDRPLADPLDADLLDHVV